MSQGPMKDKTAESAPTAAAVPFRLLPQTDSRVKRSGWQNYGESGPRPAVGGDSGGEQKDN